MVERLNKDLITKTKHFNPFWIQRLYIKMFLERTLGKALYQVKLWVWLFIIWLLIHIVPKKYERELNNWLVVKFMYKGI